MLYSQEPGSIRSPINAEAFPLVIIIGERERANLVVQLARFFLASRSHAFSGEEKAWGIAYT